MSTEHKSEYHGVTEPFEGSNHWNTVATYDDAGNMTAMRTQTMTFDAESRMIGFADSSGGASVSFGYDGGGRRVSKTAGTTTTTYVYDPAGNLAVEYGGATVSSNQTLYLTQDHLGSTRLVTTGTGTCVGAHDYLPFGEHIPAAYGRASVGCYATADRAVRFTGQERDAETAPGGSSTLSGIDNYIAMMTASPQGRF